MVTFLEQLYTLIQYKPSRARQAGEDFARMLFRPVSRDINSSVATLTFAGALSLAVVFVVSYLKRAV